LRILDEVGSRKMNDYYGRKDKLLNDLLHRDFPKHFT